MIQDIVCEAALQIVDIIGCYDTVIASGYLSLYQVMELHHLALL